MADAALDVINSYTRAMREAFDPASAVPPIGGGSTDVRFLAGDIMPLAVWNAHTESVGCDAPFLWVRLIRRYKSRTFPSPIVDAGPCDLPTAIGVEIGAARCAVTDAEPEWAALADEAEISIDDSWRIELAMCRVAGLIKADGFSFAEDSILPFGPEGGILGWVGTSFVHLI